MNNKVLSIIPILFLCLIFGFDDVSYSLNKISHDEISELKILKYLPKDNKTFFISNIKSSEITNNIRKNYSTKKQGEFDLIKNSILAYLGIDSGTNKLEDIYNNELIITIQDNKGKGLDDFLIIFKIKEKKNIDDILSLTNEIDEPDKMIKIYREKKLNYLKYIYRTNDNYIISSSNNKLILNALQSNNSDKEINTNYTYFHELLKNFKNENNILITKEFETNQLLNNENYIQTKDDYIATLFNLEGKKIILKSYLINNKKGLDIASYQQKTKKKLLDNKNYKIIIYNDFLNSVDFIKLNSFEKAFLKELNDKLKDNILFFVYEDNWITIFDKNNKNKFSMDNIKLLEDFNKYILENNDIIYRIFSKNILKKEKNRIKEINYNNIFSAESENLTFVSNSLLNDEDINLISKEFSDIQDKGYPNYFLNKKINLKNPYSIKFQNPSFSENINYFFKNIINLSPLEFTGIIKQSIPESTPKLYTETNLEIFE